MIQAILLWALRLLPLGITVLIVSNCTMLGLNRASLNTDGKPAPIPAIEAADLDAWTAQRDALRAAFETHVYGAWPEGTPVDLISHRVADEAYLGGLATLEEFEIGLGGVNFRLGLAVPNDRAGPLPVIIGQTFSSNCAVFASTALNRAGGGRCESTEVPGFVTYIFGEHIAHPPLADIFDAGFAYASFHASDVVADDGAAAPADLAAFASRGGTAPTGAIMAWAYGYSAAIDVLSGDDRLDLGRIAAFGHSRHGKSALVAGVWEPRIDVVLAHQSGYGGAALSRSTAGEGVAQMTQGARVAPFLTLPGYAHWFDPAYASYAGQLDELPVDQHQLLALLAPKPAFLGNARRDVWSDPNSTFRAARAASAVYGLYGSDGLGAAGMRDFQPDDTIAYFLRAGGHGTDARDMTAILAFLNAHMSAPQPAN
ncbi:MAG: hypothetical protein AAF253_11145 [Pseudomonadota bacterium]